MDRASTPWAGSEIHEPTILASANVISEGILDVSPRPKEILATSDSFDDGDPWWANRFEPRFGRGSLYLYDFLA